MWPKHACSCLNMRLFKNKKETIILIISLILAIGIVLFILTFSDVIKSRTQITSTAEPVIELTTDKVIISVGDEFNALDYIKTATDSNGDDISQGITTPDLDTSKAGTYEITFSYKEGDEIIKSKTLKVIVANKGE